MAEWVEFRSTSGCSGWSARGGQTTGLFHPGMKASGSSGGGAVAVGLGVVGVALGTETCYCIVSPAEKSGIIGFKPTRGLLSSKGLIHASKRLDTVGVLARTVADTQLVLTTSINTYLTSLNTNPQNITDLASLIAFTKDHPAEQYPHRNVEGLENAQAADTNAPLYKTMPEKNDYFINGEGGIHATLTACCADVMILPTLSPTMQTLAAKAGSPVMSVPMGTLPADTAVEKDEGSGLICPAYASSAAALSV
ncbi:conserved hypothetical protein [Pyrenophora tritici-repentis Pt-1C-BFP]|uniref:Amidase domain-containing protein n=1 Tax=Pyrenophora tritici-repentis (strain Pt-1C-BFP) TaxID=426418 RepID=B2W0D6_PYRTR|nr:uncharacterized protein PTRG_03921 [Pyrenophora tritici-repentis Pt-1C-BFP]EDU46759.1 conserved hypothetical protein [Pyrenophora tritici-repentis Pt-1C-BFP]